MMTWINLEWTVETSSPYHHQIKFTQEQNFSIIFEYHLIDSLIVYSDVSQVFSATLKVHLVPHSLDLNRQCLNSSTLLNFTNATHILNVRNN